MDHRRNGGYDKNMSRPAKDRVVVFALYEGVQLLDVAGPADVLALASELHPGEGYDLRFIAPAGVPLRSTATLVVQGEPAEATPAAIHTLIIPGGARVCVDRACRDAAFTGWLRGAAARSTRLASICTGALLLGAIGALDGRRAATHWSAVDRLAAAVPAATIDRNALFIEDGPVWTSAGVSTGIDLALALVARDLGPETALYVARELVVHLLRPGGQSQYSRPLELQSLGGDSITRLIPWITERLDLPINVNAMADAMGMTERTFHRRCVTTFGLSPARLVVELRLEHARMLLADATISLARIAHCTGFADSAAFSKAFKKRFDVAPAVYRRAFAA